VTAQATWNSGETGEATFTSGDLSMEVGIPTWRQATPGVAQPESGPLDTDHIGFVSMPGDVIEIVVPVTTYLVGDNLHGGFSVTCADIGGELDASFYVQNVGGGRITPDGALGTSIEVPGLVGSDAGIRMRWSVVITATVGGDYLWTSTGSPASTTPLLEQWAVGACDVSLVQIRTGDGFVDQGGGP